MSKQFLLDEDRPSWKIAMEFPLNAVVGMDGDAVIRWLGAYSDSQLGYVQKYAMDTLRLEPVVIPLVIELPDLPCELNLWRTAATASIEFSQFAFPVVGTPRAARSNAKPRKARRAAR